MCCAASGLPIRPGAHSAMAGLGPILGAFCKQLVSPAELLPWVASVNGENTRHWSLRVSFLQMLKACHSVHPCIHLSTFVVGEGPGLCCRTERCVWRFWDGESCWGRCLF